MGLMGFFNNAHGVFAAAGGYATITLMDRWGVPFLAAVAAAVAIVAFGSVILERLLYRRFYGGDVLDQVLLTTGLIFVSVAVANYLWGPLWVPLRLPAYLKGDFALSGRAFSIYRTALIFAGAAVISLLWLSLERTRFGARIRATVDNRRMAQSIGINTSRLFTGNFALGSALAALGGALGAEILPIEPTYALKYLDYFLIVVVLGGLGTIKGPFFAALLLGLADTGFKYFLPEAGTFVVYALTLLVLLWRPEGLFGVAR
jgi:branched-chain amino acid transport system permease protein